eukprot:3020472-Pyramimonas_sp.AAC.1
MAVRFQHVALALAPLLPFEDIAKTSRMEGQPFPKRGSRLRAAHARFENVTRKSFTDSGRFVFNMWLSLKPRAHSK